MKMTSLEGIGLFIDEVPNLLQQLFQQMWPWLCFSHITLLAAVGGMKMHKSLARCSTCNRVFNCPSAVVYISFDRFLA